MDLSIDRSALLTGLKAARVAVATRTSLPILEYVRLEALAGGGLALAATDMEVGLKTTVPATVKDPGAVAVPAALAFSLLSQCADETLTLRVEKNGKVRLAGPTTRLLLPTLDAENFPNMPGIDPDDRPLHPLAETTTEAFAAALARVVHAAAADTSRPVLHGVSLRPVEGGLLLECADSFRCALATLPGVVAEGGADRALVPAKRLAALVGALGAGPLAIGSLGSVLRLATAETTAIIRTIDGLFPDLLSVIPRKFTRTIRLPHEETARAVRLATVPVAKQESPLVTLSFGPEGLDVSSADDAEAAVTVPLPEPAGAPVAIHLNARYLAEALGALEVPEIACCLDDPHKLVLFRAWATDGCEQGLMPIHKAGQ